MRWDLTNKFPKKMNSLHTWYKIHHSRNKDSRKGSISNATNPPIQFLVLVQSASEIPLRNSIETRWRGANSFWPNNVDSKQISNLKRKVSVRIWPRFAGSFLGLARILLGFFGSEKDGPNISSDVWPRLTPKLFHF